ncbi:MAG: hypothetical protein ACOCZ9_03485 [Spirochaetota bacterium]
MKRLHLVAMATIMAICTIPVFAIEESLEQADDLHTEERYEQAMEVLETAQREARTDRQRAEVGWRRARTTLSMVDRDLAAGTAEDSEAIERLEQGEEYAADATENNPRLAEAWFWQAANMGRRGQVRGVLNSLFMASDVRDLAFEAIALDEDLTEPYFLLGVMYRELPGGIISFGDDQKAVSLARLAVERHEEDRSSGDAEEVYYNHYIELAHNLWERNWNERRRNRRQSGIRDDYRDAESNLDRAFNYEGTVNLESMSDREEALEILGWVIDDIEAMDSPSQGQRDDLAEARELREEWN